MKQKIPAQLPQMCHVLVGFVQKINKRTEKVAKLCNFSNLQ
jgi:hypothetical protein